MEAYSIHTHTPHPAPLPRSQPVTQSNIGLCARGPESWMSLPDLDPSLTPGALSQSPTHSASSSASGPGHVAAVSGPVPGPATPPPAAVPAAAATGPGRPCPSDPRPSRQPDLSGPLGLLPSGSSQGGCWEGERPPSGGHCQPGPALPSPQQQGGAWVTLPPVSVMEEEELLGAGELQHYPEGHTDRWSGYNGTPDPQCQLL